MDQALWYKRICTQMRMGLFVGPAKNLSESTALIDDDEKKTNKQKTGGSNRKLANFLNPGPHSELLGFSSSSLFAPLSFSRFLPGSLLLLIKSVFAAAWLSFGLS